MRDLQDTLRLTRLLLTDVDGVLNDGSLFYSADGEVLKTFNVRDGLGASLLQHAGVKVGIVTGRTSAALEKRLAELGVSDVRTGVIDKAEACLALMVKHDIEPEHVVFLGDDLPDLPAFAVCGCAVADAHPAVMTRADLVLARPGGHGALRELADAILVAQGQHDLINGHRYIASSGAELGAAQIRPFREREEG